MTVYAKKSAMSLLLEYSHTRLSKEYQYNFSCFFDCVDKLSLKRIIFRYFGVEINI